MKQLKEKVKELRQKRSWAQEDLARKIGVSLSTVQRWEKKGGEPTRLARRELKKLFRAAGIDDMTEET
jgi:transcriptional regulator with XRE-family HTH domain